jgi:hypothetical protein
MMFMCIQTDTHKMFHVYEDMTQVSQNDVSHGVLHLLKGVRIIFVNTAFVSPQSDPHHQ